MPFLGRISPWSTYTFASAWYIGGVENKTGKKKGKDKSTMNTNYYLEEKLMKDRQTELLAQARRETLVRELKQAAVERVKARNSTKANKPKFKWFFGTKNRPVAGTN